MKFKHLASTLSAVLLATACTRPIDVQAIRPGSNWLGLTEPDLGDSESAAAIDVVITANAARWMARFGDNSVHLRLHRCGALADDGYPAPAFVKGRLFDTEAVSEMVNAGKPVVLTFFLPERVQQRGQYDCGTLDARGMTSPVYFKSTPKPLPKGLQFQRPAMISSHQRDGS